MKIIVALILSCLMHLQAETIAQTVSISKKNADIVDVFREIKRQTGYNVLCSSSILKQVQKVDVDLKNMPLELALSSVLEPKGLTYRVKKKEVIVIKASLPILSKKEKSPLLSNSFSQDTTLFAGRVVMSDGVPLGGATIRIKGTSISTITNKEGLFQITHSQKPFLLEVSFVGFKSKEISVTATQKDITVVLEEDALNIEDVVIHTGYEEVSFERSTGAVTVITAEELEKQSGFSLKDRIEGLVPGMFYEVQFDEDQNASLEKSRSIAVRGIGTFADNNPLIVVDGVAFNSDIVDPWSVINPDDVASVTVLKDAASASIWGAQAANGVIVIVTKKGASGTVASSDLRVSADFMVKEAPNLQKIPWASSQEAIDIYRWAILDKDWYDNLMNPGALEEREYPEAMRTLVQMKMGTLSSGEGDKRLQELARLDVRDEFSRLFLNDLEANQKFNLSLSHGSRGNSVRTSLTANKKTGYNKGNSGLEITANFNNDYTPVNGLTLSIGANYFLTHTQDNGININELSNIPQMSRILDHSGQPLSMMRREFFTFPFADRQDTVAKYNLPYDWRWNLKEEHDAMDNTYKSSNLRLIGGIKLQPIAGLHLNVVYQYQKDHTLRSEYYDESRWYVRNLVNLKARPDGTLPVPRGGMLYEYQSNGDSHNARFQLNYDKRLQDHSFKAFAGMEVRMDYMDGIPYGLYGYDPQALTNIMNLNFADPITPQMDGKPGSTLEQTVPLYPTGRNTISLRGTNRRFLSHYGNVGYNFRNKLDLTGSIRLDRTNLFGQSSTFTHLPQWSAGIGYILSRESYFSKLSWVDLLKVRASYGFNGNIDKSASPYIMGSPWIDPLTDLPYTAVQVAPNPALTWEKTGTYNVGVDYSFLKRKIQGGFEVYMKRAQNVLAQIEVNGTYGYQNNRAALNTGNITNKGIEFYANIRAIDRKVYSWDTKFTYGTNHNKATKITTVTKAVSSFLNLPYYYHLPDQPVDYVASIQWAGYGDDGYPQFHYQDQVMSALDVTNINLLNTFDVIDVYGRRNPTHFGRFSNAFRYKWAELQVNLLYKFGHVFYSDYPASNLAVSYFSSGQFQPFIPELLIGRWRSPSDADRATMYSLERKLTSVQSSFLNVLSRYNTNLLHNAGNIRIQSISLSFLLPKPWLPYVKNARLRLEARDLGPIYVVNKLGLDPDFPVYSSSTYGGINSVIRNRASYYLSLNFAL